LRHSVLGDPNAREVKRHLEWVADANELEPLMEKLTADELKAKTAELRQRLAQGEGLDDVLVEAFAVVREAARRSIGLRPFDVQLVGGIVLHQGKIAEMKTGEGKTLVAVLPLYLNALEGKGAHLITVNDYLARRDAGWNAPIYQALGMSVAVIGHEMSLLYDPDYLDETHPDPAPAASSSHHEGRGLPGRHHLWHEQRVRLRLPARQHGGRSHAVCPARAELRHR